MNSVTVNLSFQKQLLNKIDRVAKNESISRSELLREAARMYINRKSKWDDVFALGDKITTTRKITEKDVVAQIKAHRKSQ